MRVEQLKYASKIMGSKFNMADLNQLIDKLIIEQAVTFGIF